MSKKFSTWLFHLLLILLFGYPVYSCSGNNKELKTLIKQPTDEKNFGKIFRLCEDVVLVLSLSEEEKYKELIRDYEKIQKSLTGKKDFKSAYIMMDTLIPMIVKAIEDRGESLSKYYDESLINFEEQYKNNQEYISKSQKVDKVGDPFKDWDPKWNKRGWLYNPLDYNKWVPGEEGKAPLPPRWLFEPMRYDNEYDNWQNVIYDLRKHLEYDIPATTWHIDRPFAEFYDWLTPAGSFVISGHKEYWDKAPRQGTAMIQEFTKRGLRFGLYQTSWGVRSIPPPDARRSLLSKTQMTGWWNLEAPEKITEEIKKDSINLRSEKGMDWWLKKSGFDDLYKEGVRFIKNDYEISNSSFILKDLQEFINKRYPHPVVLVGGHDSCPLSSQYNCAMWTGDPKSNFYGLRTFGFLKEWYLKKHGHYYVGTDIGGCVYSFHYNLENKQNIFLRWCGHEVFSEIFMSTFWLWSKKQPQLWPDHYDYVPYGSPRNNLGFKTKGGYTTIGVLAWDDPHNPFTKDGEKFLEIYRYWATFCYELVPYKFSYAHIAHNAGEHIRRLSKEDSTIYDNYQYLCGDWFLNAPIVDENIDNETGKINPHGEVRRVKVPSGYWYDWWKPIRYIGSGEAWFDYRGDWARHPLLLKAGAIIPLQVMNDGTGHGRLASKPYLTLDVYPDEKGSEFDFYEGEAGSKPHKLTCSVEKNEYMITFGGRIGKYILRIAVESPESVLYGNSNLNSTVSADKFWETEEMIWFYDSNEKRLWIRIHHKEKDKQVFIRGATLYSVKSLSSKPVINK
ncbi:hypothetical protein ACFL4V_00980 [Candidatus Latescibacterota bacterium]